LNIASRNRTSFELTMAGTTVATVNLSYWLIKSLFYTVYGIIELIIDPDNTNSDIWTVLFVLLLFMISNYIIWKKAKKQYREWTVIVKAQV